MTTKWKIWFVRAAMYGTKANWIAFFSDNWRQWNQTTNKNSEICISGGRSLFVICKGYSFIRNPFPYGIPFFTLRHVQSLENTRIVPDDSSNGISRIQPNLWVGKYHSWLHVKQVPRHHDMTHSSDHTRIKNQGGWGVQTCSRLGRITGKNS